MLCQLWQTDLVTSQRIRSFLFPALVLGFFFDDV